MCTGPLTREPAPEGPSLIVGSGVLPTVFLEALGRVKNEVSKQDYTK